MGAVRRLSDAERKFSRAAASKAWHERNPEYKKGWVSNNKDRNRASQQKYYRKNPDARKNTVLKNRYGITLAERDAMLMQQGGCAVCGSGNSGTYKDWQTDHSHQTGKVRGILCIQCNIMLGAARDSIQTLSAAIAYLRASGAA